MEISVSHISKKYGKNQILKDISFTASKGQCICFTGANGCGKTTLLSILAGTLKPDGGSISFAEGREDSKAPAGSASPIAPPAVGYLPQVSPLLEKVSVRGNLSLWCKNRDELEHMLGEFELDSIAKKPVSHLSGGMKRRLALACALSDSPDILLMDEPTTALDVQNKELIHNIMKKCLEEGKIIIMVSHDSDEIALATQRYTLSDGQLV